MSSIESNEPPPRNPLRLWPGVIAAVLLCVVRFIVPPLVPGGGVIGVLGGLAGALLVIVWWLFFSRAAWSDRVGAIVLMVVVLIATSPLVHPSISNGMMGMMLPVFTIPLLSLGLVVSLVLSRRLSHGAQRAFMVVAMLFASGTMTLVRTGGVTGDGDSDIHWRWTKTPEERLLAQADIAPLDSARGAAVTPAPAPSVATPPPARASGAADNKSATSASAPTPGTPEKREPAATAAPLDSARTVPTERSGDPSDVKTAAEWPGFRGSARDGIVRGIRIETDWSRKPPVELWRRPIGPGWSSFAVRGDLVYTQEQRGNDEVVSCYRLSTGEPVWRHRDAVRFWESNAGAGPRATPTLHDDRVYTLGATGLVNALDARNGAMVWSRNAATDTGKEIPDWGFAGSPLVVNDLVLIALAGQLVAYDLRTGNPRWVGPSEGGGYSSPHLMRIGGVDQVVLLRGRRTTSFAPADGTVLWEYSWQPAVSVVQPALVEDGNILVAAGDAMGGIGMRRIAASHGPTGWAVEERWTSRGLKPYFNDFVVHKGNAFGFDGSILACIDLSDGTRKWKGGRYGHGQLVLLPDSDVLLVLSEDGELALVKAAADQFTELARLPAIEGKTWNHPVVVGDILLVRNGQEMAAFRLALAGR